jgi:ABC-type oligopeptide transport system ATPase subunit
MSRPNFENLLKVLRREEPDRPTLFEFFLNTPLYNQLAGPQIANMTDEMAWVRVLIHAFMNAGYDYVNLHGSSFHFPKNTVPQLKTRSLNDGAIIFDGESFESYSWPNPEDFDYSILERVEQLLPDGMKVIVWGPGGVLENVIDLVGYDNLCYMLFDDPGLTRDIFDAVGSRFVRYYEICAQYPSVGALISNDDWGFKTQTMLPPADMRRYIIPWLTVEENIKFGLDIKNVSKQLKQERAEEFMEIVGLTPYRNYFPRQLSSSMLQRVSIARAFATKPDLLLMDEPYGQLDIELRYKLEDELIKLWEATGTTVLFITHNIEEAVYLGEKILVLTNKPTTVKTFLENNIPRPRDIASDDFVALRNKVTDLIKWW